jgi:hypothetical protein
VIPLAVLLGGSAPEKFNVSYGSYYASAAAWALDATWLFGGDKLIWAILLALAGGVIGVIKPLIAQMWKKAMGRSTTASQITAKTIQDLLNASSVIRGIVGIAIVLVGAFVVNFGRYPPIHEAKLQSRPHILGSSATFIMLDTLQRANLKVLGGMEYYFYEAL